MMAIDMMFGPGFTWFWLDSKRMGNVDNVFLMPFNVVRVGRPDIGLKKDKEVKACRWCLSEIFPWTNNSFLNVRCETLYSARYLRSEWDSWVNQRIFARYNYPEDWYS